VSDVGDGVLGQADVGIHLNRHGVSSPVEHEVLRRIRVCTTQQAARMPDDYRVVREKVTPFCVAQWSSG